MKNILFAVFVTAILLTGCIQWGEQKGTTTNKTTAPSTTPNVTAPMPSFTIISPAQYAEFENESDVIDIDVSLSTSNLILKPSGGTAKTGEGHFKFTVDGGSAINVFTKSYTIKAVPVGNHTLVVELMNNDNTPYSPAIKKSVTFEVKQKQPTVYQPKSYTVEIKDFSFSPSYLTVKVGDSIVFKNTGQYPRSATSTGNFDTQVLASGKEATITMNKEGTYDYFSLTYKTMTGKIIVVSNSTTSN